MHVVYNQTSFERFDLCNAYNLLGINNENWIFCINPRAFSGKVNIILSVYFTL